MIGGTTTGATLAMMPLFEEAQIPLISLAGAIQIVEPVRKWVFKTPHTDKMACEKIFADLKQRNLTTVALISGTDAFGKSMRDQCVAVAPKAGITIAHEESYGPRDSDTTPQLTNIKGKAGVQAVINPGFGQGPAIVTRNYRAARHRAAALSEPRRHLQAVHRLGRAGRGRRAAAGGRVARRRKASGQRSAKASGHRIHEDLPAEDRPADLRASAATPTTG